MIEQVIPVREVDLIGDLKVKRILPFRSRRMVGPFTFLDEMGPMDLRPGAVGDVPPHPHIGLSTVTYLFSGELIHRDSLGSKQAICPGDVNWMTAGKGIAHSERIPSHPREESHQLHGIQAWVALPRESEETEPSFDHYDAGDLPRFTESGVQIHLIAGHAFGFTSPVQTHSRLFYFNAHFQAGQKLIFDSDSQEAAFYLVQGKVQIDRQSFQAPLLIVFQTGAKIQIEAQEDSHGLMLGGAPLDGSRNIWWNFVSSSKERIEKAKKDWRENRFPKIPEETESVSLPGEEIASVRLTLP
jgi:hypothetical protein